MSIKHRYDFLSFALLVTLVVGLAGLATHGQKQNFNPGTVTTTQFCGTTTACAGTSTQAPQVVYGSVALSSGTPSTAVITGISPAFTSNTSYKCLASDVTTITSNVVAVTYNSGSSFTITGPATVTDTVEYICAGN